jgi:hypothetical protein
MCVQYIELSIPIVSSDWRVIMYYRSHMFKKKKGKQSANERYITLFTAEAPHSRRHNYQQQTSLYDS